MKAKVCLPVLVLCAAVLLFAPGLAEEPVGTGRCGDFAYSYYADGTARVTTYLAYDTNVVIPSVLDGYPVTAIDDEAFSYGRERDTVSIPNSVTKVDGNPFVTFQEIRVSPDHPTLELIDGVLFDKTEKRLIAYPRSLEAREYAIPDGTRSIGDEAFYGNANVFEVCIPDGLVSIGDYAFKYSSLGEINIPSSLTEIGKNPFCRCKEFGSIRISPDHPTLALIEGVLFEKTEKRLVAFPPAYTNKDYTVPQGIRVIGDSAFYDCDTLNTVKLPDSLKKIENCAFSYCLRNVSSSGTKNGEGSSSGGRGLRSIEIPYGVTEIGDAAFHSCDGLESIEIPDSVVSIGDWAFAGCDGLKSIEIPDSVVSIGSGAFQYSLNLNSVRLPAHLTKISDDMLQGTAIESILIPDGVTEIGSYALVACDFSFIEIPDSVTTIGDYAFGECYDLCYAVVPDSVTDIGEEAFAYCPLLNVIVNRGSYAERYCRENGVNHLYPDSLDWLKE